MNMQTHILSRVPFTGRVYGIAGHYEWVRKDGWLGVRDAIEHTRHAFAHNWLQRSTRGLASYQNTPNDRGGRWIESPERAGLRFAGWSDEMARLDHTGWHDDPEGDGDLYRGCVYQLPARKGRAVYVEAVRHVDWKGRDVAGVEGSAIVYLRERHLGEPGGEDDYEAKRDAARGADGEAEIIAECERDYRQAWNAGQAIAELREDAKRMRAEARPLLAEIRAFTDGDMLRCPISCRAVRDMARDLLSDARKLRQEARQAVENWDTGWRSEAERDAFKEGLAS